ncbi:DNA cytosine methyltransferase, partial [Salmonella enterica]|nr:DNA cytosine methyltransferase [Salmonella enterica]
MNNLSYGSVCSGIEAASIAWEPLGMRPAWFSEIEPFPCAVLAERWPEVPNLGDMTKIAASIAANEVAAPDLLVGGTPCQAFSIAGLRKGLADKRGQLTLAYVELVNAIDYSRIRQGLPPVIFCWENVPGVLSSKDNAFGCFLAGLAGEDEPFKPGPQPERGKNSTFWRWDKKARKHYPKWPQSGCVVGRQRKLAWRVLDAEYFGVPQRRHRVFVVGSAGEGFDPETILFEFEGVRRNTPPSKKTWQTVAALTANGVGTCGADDNQGQAGHLQVVGALAAHSFTGGAGGRPEGAAAGHFIPVAVMAHGQGGAE